jgi:hypothetical protein
MIRKKFLINNVSSSEHATEGVLKYYVQRERATVQEQ